MIAENIKSLVGNTPLLKIACPEIPEANVYVKLESFNPTGSIKDRACLYSILAAEQSGALRNGKTILDASSGNMACSLAYFGYVLGYPVKVVCGSKLTADKRDFIEYFGAELVFHGDLTFQGNALCREMAAAPAAGEDYCFLDQLHNPANPVAAEETLGPEIYADLPEVRAIAGSMGTGGSMCGVARFIKRTNPSIGIFTAQAAPGTRIPGTGSFDAGDYATPFVTELASVADASFRITQYQAEERTRQLRKQGVFAGFQAGGVLETLIRGVKKFGIGGDVVMIIGDAGWKNMDKLKSMA